MRLEELKRKMKENGLKITPQRIAVMEALSELDDHPTADRVLGFIRKKYPNISQGTVYNILEVLVKNNIITKVKTEKDIMRYDAVTERHHHLYGTDSDRIIDYFDNELDELLINYFKNKNIPGFKIEDIKLHIHGKFKEK